WAQGPDAVGAAAAAALRDRRFDDAYKLAMSVRDSSPVAQQVLGDLLRQGAGVVRDPVTARAWLARSAEGGNMTAAYEPGAMGRRGEAGRVGLPQARAWLKRAADGAFAPARTGYADMAWRGEGGPADKPEALRYFQAAAGQGDAGAMVSLASAYER